MCNSSHTATKSPWSRSVDQTSIMWVGPVAQQWCDIMRSKLRRMPLLYRYIFIVRYCHWTIYLSMHVPIYLSNRYLLAMIRLGSGHISRPCRRRELLLLFPAEQVVCWIRQSVCIIKPSVHFSLLTQFQCLPVFVLWYDCTLTSILQCK